MYRTIQHQMSIDDYLPPYEGELVQENRWVRLAQAIDWDAIEQEYSGHFAAGGKVAIPARMAFGVLVIRAACRTTDSETVEIVRESPYLQYFLGFDSFTYDVPFSSRSMERFRTRISPARVREAVALLRRLRRRADPRSDLLPCQPGGAGIADGVDQILFATSAGD